MDIQQEVLSQYVKGVMRTMYDIQEVRVRVDNRIDALERLGGDEVKDVVLELQGNLSTLAHKMEANAERALDKAVSRFPVIEWLEKVRGIGPRYAGSLVGVIAPISRFESVSALWAYCGLHTVRICANCNKLAPAAKEKEHFLNRQVERRWEIAQLRKEKLPDEEDFKRKQYSDSEAKLCSCTAPEIQIAAPNRKYYAGLLLDHNTFLRMTCWKIAAQFVKQGKFYRTIYEQRKERYTERDGAKLSAGHIENRARRAMIKLFISHLWEMWRKSEGLAVGETYLQYKLGQDFAKRHTLILPPYADIFDIVEKQAAD